MSAALYSSLDLTIGDLERIKLPPFQRKLVWTQKKKEDFIDTLRQGLPFGAVLIYPEDQTNESMLQILDGQQRLSTILEYKKCPLRFWKPLNREEYQSSLDRINDMLPDEEHSKAKTCVDKAFEIWEDTKGEKSAQLIFCDLSTPKAC